LIKSYTYNIGYLNREVPDGKIDWLKVYFYNPMTGMWEVLPTALDRNFNTLTAQTQGPGLYVLMSSIEIGLAGPGWNMKGYPILDTRPITKALASIEGYYTRVCHYQTEDIRDHWKCFGANVPPWVNDLTQMEFGDGYWIYATETITWYLKGDGQSGMTVDSQEEKSSLIGPPATYYGTLTESNSFVPQAGMTLTAWIDGNLCGQTTTVLLNGQIVYVIDIASALDLQHLTGCGLPGKVVRFQVNGYNVLSTVPWEDSQTWEEPLVPGYYWYYLPIIERP
jgi:hypothetical protein